MKKLLFIALALTTVLFSCDEDDKGDLESPVITFSMPAATDTFVNGDTIHVHGMVTDNGELHEVTMKITDETHGTTIHEATEHSHDNPYHFSHMFVVSVPMHTDIKILVTAEDDAGNVGENSIQKHIMQ